MTTTSLKHIVSNVENIRNPVITHCYYGNLLLLSGLWFPSAFVSLCFMCFYFCSFLLQPVFVSRFYNPYLVLRFRPPSHLSCASFCIPSFRSSSFYLLSKHISRDPINGMRTLFRTRCLVSASFLYPYFYRYHLAGMLHWIHKSRRLYVGCWLPFGTNYLVFYHTNII